MKVRNKIEEIRIFRSLMGVSLLDDDIFRIWGIGKKKESKKLDSVSEEKIQILRKNLNKLMFFNKVKFVGISGSVGAGFAKEDDDIDLFIVVENNTMWLYRLYLELYNLSHNMIRSKRHGENVKDKFCINLIVEERGLSFPNDIFTFHELMFLKPVFNEEYIKYIYACNVWLLKEWGIRSDLLENNEREIRSNNLLIRVLNFIAYIFQLLFMLLSGHKPDIKRIRENNRIGRIEFFPKNFRVKKIRNFEKELQRRNS
ncbi:MAG: nucleotidyltransferase domain-containing protein [Candidatus Dojkabacteria bacterium]|jgi:predicted nucleotidyltransferase